jgi:hypothetical protein
VEAELGGFVDEGGFADISDAVAVGHFGACSCCVRWGRVVRVELFGWDFGLTCWSCWGLGGALGLELLLSIVGGEGS